MRIAKHILLALSVLWGIGAQAQLTNQYLGGTSTAVINRGVSETDSAFGFPKDTIMRSTWPKTKPHIAAIGDSLYLWSTATQSWKNLTRVAATASAAWGSITGLLSNQPDIRDSLNARERLFPFGTALQYFRGNKTLGTLSTDVRAFTDLLYMKYTDTSSLSNRINQLSANSFTATNLVPHDGLYIDGNNIGVYNYNAQWDAKWLQKTLLSSVQPLDQQTLIYNAAKQQAEWGFLGATSNGTSDGNNYLSNLYLDTDSLKASIVGMAGFTIDLSQRFVNKQLLQSYITYVLDSTTKYFNNNDFAGTGTNLDPIRLKNSYATQVGLNDTATALRLAIQAGGANIYNSNGTLAGDRTVIVGNHLLEFQDSPDENTYLSVAHNTSSGGTIASYTLGADGAQSYIMHYANGNINRYAGSYHDTAQITEEMHPQRYHLFADSYNEGTGQNASGSSITMESRFVYLGQRDGNYQIDSLADAPAPSGGAYKALVYEQVPGNETQLRLYSKDLSTFSDGNNYVSGGNLTGGTLTLNRSGMADLAITGFNPNTGAPEDIEFTAGATGKPAAGASTITFTGSTGYEVRVIRGTVPQSTINKGDGFYYTKASSSETLTLGQPLVSGEYVRIIFYKPSGTVTY